MTVAAGGGFWHAFGAQLAHPRGRAGQATGWLMGLINREPTRLVCEALALEPRHSLLDVGCGAGQAMAACLRRCGTVHGIDRSQTMVEAARRRNRRAIAAGRCAVSAGCAEALPFPDRRFDRVMACNVMYFWQDVPRALAELQCVLRPGGRIVLYVTDARSMRSWPFARAGSHRLFEANSLEDELRAATEDRLTVRLDRVRLSGAISGLIATLTEDGAEGVTTVARHWSQSGRPPETRSVA